MIKYIYEALHNTKYAVWEKVFAELCRYDRENEISGRIFWITDEYGRLLDLECSAKKELEDARKKFFGSN